MSSERFCCDTCPKSFCTRGRYNQHLKTHSRPFRCEPCQRGFALRLDLNRHIKTRHRLGHEPLSCPYDEPDDRCTFQSNRKDNLARHLRNIHGHERETCKEDRQTENIIDGDDSLTGSPPNSLDSLDQLHTDSLFRQAASSGNLSILEASLHAGIDLHSKAKDGSTALHCAARAGQDLAVQFLLTNGAKIDDLNSHGRSPLMEAIIGGYLETVRALFNACPTIPFYRSVVKYLAQSGNIKIVQLYIEKQSVSSDTLILQDVFMAALRFGKTALVAALLDHPEIQINKKDGKGIAPIHQVARYGRVESLHLLIASISIDLNVKTSRMRSTPLHLAAHAGHHEIAEILLKQHSIMVNLTTLNAYTPLHLAAKHGHVKVVEHLLSRDDVDINCRDFYLSPLHLAAFHEHWDVISLLLDHWETTNSHINISKPSMGKPINRLELLERLWRHPDFEDITSEKYLGQTLLHCAVTMNGLNILHSALSREDVNVNVVDKNGFTLLYTAVAITNAQAVQCLLQHKDIDVNRGRFMYGHTLMQLARSWGNQHIVDLLLAHGAIDNSNIPPTAENGDYIIKEVSDIPTTIQPELDLEVQHQSLFDEYMADLEAQELDMDDMSDLNVAA